MSSPDGSPTPVAPVPPEPDGRERGAQPARAGAPAPASDLDPPRAARPAWLVALGWFTLAVLVLWAGWFGATATRWASSVNALAVPVERMAVTRGSGSLEGPHLVIRSYEGGTHALVAFETAALPSADYGTLRWDLRGGEGAELAILWRSSFYPGRVFSRKVDWTKDRLWVRLDGDPNWIGRISGLALVVRGPGATPLRVGRAVIEPSSMLWTARAVLMQWTQHEPWRQSSTNFVYGGNPDPFIRLLPAAALVALLAAAGYVGSVLLLRRAPRPGVLLGVLALTWMAVDATALWSGTAQARETFRTYAGKSDAEALQAGEDGGLYRFAEQVREHVRPGQDRVFVFAGDGFVRGRTAYHLIPATLYVNPRSREMLPASTFRAGDVLVLVRLPGILYSPQDRQLAWSDGGKIAADPLVVAGAAMAFRVR